MAVGKQKSPKLSRIRCKNCKKIYKNEKSLKEHQRHHCKKSPTSKKRVYTPVTCRHCKKTFHSSNSLRVHCSTQHPKEYRNSPTKSYKDHVHKQKQTQSHVKINDIEKLIDKIKNKQQRIGA